MSKEIIPPYSQEAEQSVLGAIILDGSCLNNIIDILPNSSFFYVPINKLIYDTVINMFASGLKIDYVTILNEIYEKNSTKKNEIKNYMRK